MRLILRELTIALQRPLAAMRQNEAAIGAILDAARRPSPYCAAMAVHVIKLTAPTRWWWRRSKGVGAGRCCTL